MCCQYSSDHMEYYRSVDKEPINFIKTSAEIHILISLDCSIRLDAILAALE